MNKLILEIGNRYGRLIVKERFPENKDGKAQWICRCDCGNVHVAQGKLLRGGKIKSCGCWLKDNPPRKLPGKLGAQRWLMRDYKKSARERDLEFDLEFEDFINLVEASCYYCGLSPNRPHYRHPDYLSNGIDRMYNDKGYVLDNCVPCCWVCNQAKGTMDYDEFTSWLEKIVEHWS